MKALSLLPLLILFYSCSHKVSLQNTLSSNSNKENHYYSEGNGSKGQTKNLEEIGGEENEELRSALWLNSQMIFELNYLSSRLKNCFTERQKYIHKGDFSPIEKTDQDETRILKGKNPEEKLKLERSRHKKLLVVKQEIKSQLLRCEYLPL